MVRIKERSGFFGSRDNGISHELGFIGAGVRELVESEVADREREIFIAEFQGFQQEGGDPFVNLSHTIKLLLFSRDALLKSQEDVGVAG